MEPSRALGQNFMVDANMVDKIVRLAGVKTGDNVVEIGPGVGALSVALLEAGVNLVAVEADRYLLEPLAEVTEGMPINVLHQDATELGWVDALGDNEWAMVANLPYNVATPLVLDTLADVPQVSKLTFLVQREVADRLAAKPGDPAFGLPSLHASFWAKTEMVAKVPPTVFFPQPRVDSALVQMTRLDVQPDRNEFESVMGLARTAFGQRRKMLRKSLGGVVDPAKFVSAEVDPTARPQELTLEQWKRLAK